jgi:hypothetical protein
VLGVGQLADVVYHHALVRFDFDSGHSFKNDAAAEGHKRKWLDQFYYPHGRLPVVMAAGSATRGRSKSQVKKCAERCWQFANPYLMVIVIFSETIGGLNG